MASVFAEAERKENEEREREIYGIIMHLGHIFRQSKTVSKAPKISALWAKFCYYIPLREK